MKGIMYSSVLLLLTCVLTLSLVLLSEFEHVRAKNAYEIKRALRYAMTVCLNKREDCSPSKAGSIIAENLERNRVPGYRYGIDILGYHHNPLLIRVRVVTSSTEGIFRYEFLFDETMIEEEKP